MQNSNTTNESMRWGGYDGMLVDGRWLEMEMKRYEMGRSIGSGNFGVAKLMRDKRTGEKVAVKFLERGGRIDERVAREIVNHRSLRHPNVIRFKEVALTPTYLAIVMEYAPGGDLFELLRRHGPLPEDRARCFFRQLVSGVAYCHSMQICHRDLKLENTLLAGTPSRPLLKICDFGYSKSSLLHSKPNSRVGSPSYIAPEIFACNEYDGKAVDIWSCGVSLYVMIVGRYPFEDENDPNNLRNTVTRIMDVKYRFPDGASISVECRHLLSKIFVADPARRITIDGIMKHPWLEKEFPPHQSDQSTANSTEDLSYGYQSVEEVLKIVQEAGTEVENSMDEVIT